MCFVVLQAVQILVSLLADFAFVWLLLLHTHGAWVWCRCLRIDNRESAVCIIVEPLVVVAMLEIRQ